MSRQVGKSLACAFEAVSDALETGKDWLILSAGEKQAKEFIFKVIKVARIFCEAAGLPDPECTVLGVTLPNKARIFGLPSNPATVRGYSCNIILDEAAFHERSEELWRAVFPVLSNPLKGGLKCRVISTPSGKNNLFYRLWSGDGMANGGPWSRHKVDIYDAAEAGLNLDVEELRIALDDPDGWAQEYECEFLEEATQLFPYELIQSCVSDQATMESSLPRHEGLMRYGGGDIGRHRDLSCSWLLKTIAGAGERILTTEEVVIMERMDFESQQAVFGERIKCASRFAIDATGIGEETGERLTMRYGEGRVIPVKMTSEFKNELFPGLKHAMQQRRVLLPSDERIKKSLASLQKQVTPGGTVRYVAAHTADGHADEATALALAVWAARKPTGAMTMDEARSVRVPGSAFRVPTVRF